MAEEEDDEEDEEEDDELEKLESLLIDSGAGSMVSSLAS